MQPIEATPIPVPQPEVPRCELWAEAYFCPESKCWLIDTIDTEESGVDEQIANARNQGIPVRKFHLSDQPPPPIDLAAVAEAWDAFRGERNSPGRNDVAAFVAHLLERGVPREVVPNGE